MSPVQGRVAEANERKIDNMGTCYNGFMDLATKKAIARMAKKTDRACFIVTKGGLVRVSLPGTGPVKEDQRFRYRDLEFRVMKVGLGNDENVVFFGYVEDYEKGLAGAFLYTTACRDTL